MDINTLSNKYKIKKLNYNDCDAILNLYNSNPKYFKYCPPNPTIKTIKEDLTITPNNVSGDNKYFLGFYNDNELIGVLDLITNYPNNETCFIGLFMIDNKYQNKGIGSIIIEEICNGLRDANYKYVKLAYVINNIEAERFWIKNNFKQTNQSKDVANNLDVIVCIRNL